MRGRLSCPVATAGRFTFRCRHNSSLLQQPCHHARATILGVPRQHSLFLAGLTRSCTIFRIMKSGREIEIPFRRLRLFVRTIQRTMKGALGDGITFVPKSSIRACGRGLAFVRGSEPDAARWGWAYRDAFCIETSLLGPSRPRTRWMTVTPTAALGTRSLDEADAPYWPVSSAVRAAVVGSAFFTPVAIRGRSIDANSRTCSWGSGDA